MTVIEYLPAEANHVLISVNPTAGSGFRRRRRGIQQLERLLAESDFIAESYSDLDQLRIRSDQLQAAGQLRAVVGAGGDGTLHRLLNHLAAGIPLAMLPMGTENLLAKYVGQGSGPPGVARMIKSGRIVRLDAGRADGQLFLLMATAGFDAEVARRLAMRRSGNISHLSYLRPILSAIFHYQYPVMRMTLETQGAMRQIEACWCFTFNVPQYGFGMRFIPDADPADGLLEMCTFRGGSFWHAVWYTLNLYLRRHTRLPGCQISAASRIMVEADQPVPYELDGDFTGWLPVELDVVPGRLTLVMPAEK
ncbi:MAG: diacylglycerol kinase family protein [Pirellulales bacterium]